MKKLLITRLMPDVVRAEAEAHFDVTMRAENTALQRDEMIAALTDYDAILPTLGDLFTAEVFAAAAPPRAVMLGNFGVGYNHIDVAAAQAAGLIVSNTPGAVTDATADTALTLMLMCARRAGEGERLVRSGAWAGWHPTQMLGLHMTGKRVGIVGMGRIGAAIARRCHFGFGMSVAYVTRSPKSLDFEATPYDNLSALAENVDFLVVAVPGGTETRGLIDAATLRALGPESFVINIARGDVVDEAALIAALQVGDIAGAGLDVYAAEPVVPEALRAMENVVLLPHLGTAALEVRVDMGLMAVRNLKAVLIDGKPAPNAV